MKHDRLWSSIRRKLASLRRFFNYLERFGLCPRSPILQLGLGFRTPLRLPRIMPLADVGRLLSAPDLGAPNSGYRTGKSLRDRLILALLFFTGMRVGELVSLDISDLEVRRGTILVHGKGRKDRILYLKNDHALTLLRRYLALRSRMQCNAEALFVNRRKTRLTARSIEQIFQTYLRKAGIAGRYTPHSMRHTMATALLESGTGLRTVQDILGHSSIVSTQVYTHVAPQHVEGALAVLGRLDIG
jgi:integrase/recombinase XerC/integrase/recombinase XerD